MYSIDVNNGLNAAILVMLKDTFEKVITISEISENEKPLFIVKPNFKSKAISRNRSTGDMDFVAKLFLDFTLYVNNDLVASFSKEELIHYENPDSVTLLNILTGASLYLLSPITIPAIAQVAGEHGVDLAEGKLSTMLNEIKTDVKAEKKKLVSFLSTATTDSLIEVASTVSNAKSKYDNFLDCVVVVRTADGIGSGFLVSRNGKVITNYHVVAGEKTVSIRLRNGLTQLAKVEAIDKACDLALLKMEGDNFPWLVLEGDKMSGTGAEVLAIGTPKGLDWSVSRGIISAIRKGKSGIVVVQTDAAINPGNSGGPLIALESGKVVGINSFGYRKDTTEGLNFAIGANEIKKAFPHELK
jgi:S1-C subfamily serine protease